MKINRNIDRTQVVFRVFIALLLMILVTVYQNVSYDILNTVRWKHFKLIRNLSDYGTTETRNSTFGHRTIVPEGYLVWNENCHIPSFDPYASKYMEAEKDAITAYQDSTPNCTAILPLVTKTYNTTLQAYVLQIQMELKDEYLIKRNSTYDEDGTQEEFVDDAEEEDINCCFKTIFRDGEKGYAWNDCLKFEHDFQVPNYADYILIACNGTVNTSTFYQDGMTLIQDRDDVYEKIQNNTSSSRPFGILMFGIDSVSQFNFRRVMPLSYEYVRNDSWFELSGYNKIDDNTFPNLMAVFSGLDLIKADELCHYKEIGGLDNCTTSLFNFFREQGLITAYSEDIVDISTFDYLKPGFVKPPTDYYQRPLLMAIEEKLPIQKLSDEPYCVGPRRYGEYVYDFGIEFAERFLGQSIFGLFWTNSFSHNNWADPSIMDKRMVEYFTYMDDHGILENNVVVLFSDHGSRWGFLRSQKEGYIEERMPMFFIRLPQWMKDAHPEIVNSLMLNKNRLTSPYDVHVTLKHLALMSLGKNDPIDKPISCPTCQTLLEPVLENRSCHLAGIPDHWCTCTPFEVLDTDSDEVKNFTQLVIDELNIYLNSSVYGSQCVPMQLNRVVEANLRLDLHKDVHKDRIQYIRTTFETNPNEALFDASLVYDSLEKTIKVNVTEISRLNLYATDSVCVDDNIVKKYCICTESVKKNS
ncbi:uncharacterized protein LOC142235989 [Haematobia irritans]|uniref:uncharacterized protein LOC142235989 n=1 Tax=Haematobia irritans TaxID=7368 RepID=UPI003F508718